jgi:hypothetical protein
VTSGAERTEDTEDTEDTEVTETKATTETQRSRGAELQTALDAASRSGGGQAIAA